MLGIMRHAETFGNRYHTRQGAGDSPLTPEGVASATETGAAMTGKYSHILCSDQGRAISTAEALGLGIPIKPTFLLRERDWENETDRDVVKRLTALSITELDNALVVTHGRTARALIATLTGKPIKYISAFANCECREFDIEEDMFGIKTIVPR